MKVTLNWLKEYVAFDWNAEELGERLTMLGLEVEGIQKIGAAFEGIVVAEILTSEKHPNADKLSVCRVADGRGERQIVCGAKNYKAGDKVPLALPGTTLPATAEGPGLTIKVSKVRGVESHGMLCSPQELQMAAEADGLLILPPDAHVGQAFAEHLGRTKSDVVFDLEITPNRPDLNSVIGIAREIAAVTGHPLRLPRIPELPADTQPAAELVRVQLAAPDLCPRYVARVVRDVRIGPSPAWLSSLLEKAGLRSINNVVDITNYVMLETGQPLHAFDYHLLDRADSASGLPTILVRRAGAGEKFTTLDGQTRELGDGTLLIADETKAIALAGIMGGQNSEIHAQTRDVLLESAYFNPQCIRAASKRLDLRTDASYRFERGADIGITDWASRRAAELIARLAGGKVASGAVDNYPAPPPPREIRLRHHKVGQLLGIDLPPGLQVNLLERLELKMTRPSAEAEGQEPDAAMFRVPTFRVDLKREADLIEEIARLHGIEKIPSSAPRGALGEHPFDSVYDQLNEARRILTGLGLHEAQGQTLLSSVSVAQTAQTADSGPGPNAPASPVVRLANPLSSDMDVLRPSLIPGLLDALRHNINRKNNDAALFEIGRVFLLEKGAVREERRLAVALTGKRARPFWQGTERGTSLDAFDLKGLLEEFLDQFGIRGAAWQRCPEPGALYIESARIPLGKQTLGEFGQMRPALARQYDVRDAVFLAELNLDLLLARRNPARSFKPLPAFPAIRRDVALLVNEEVTHEAVVQGIRQARPEHLESVELFDIFRGHNVPEGQKSVAYALTYRSAERTLTDAEIQTVHARVLEQLRTGLKAAIRE